MTDVARFDEWLERSGPSAIVVREPLMPVEGADGVLFPATFAASEDKVFKGGYNIDRFPDGTNICLVDSVGSQANRIEPLFMTEPYNMLVPQVVVTAGVRSINLLEAGHRAADAIVRCSPLQEELRSAFKAVQSGDAGPLARIAPTSLVFGAWDSRDTQAKVPRLVASTIRAFNVHELTRSAQYVPAADYVGQSLLEEPAGSQAAAYAERGFVHVPASGTHGGVIATGGIRRDATLHLAALRLLVTGDRARTLVMQRYLLGLALTALTAPAGGYLRQGCSLVRDPRSEGERSTVFPDGRREPFSVAHPEAIEYASKAAAQFGVEPGRNVSFDPERARQDVGGEGGTTPGRKAKRGK